MHEASRLQSQAAAGTGRRNGPRRGTFARLVAKRQLQSFDRQRGAENGWTHDIVEAVDCEGQELSGDVEDTIPRRRTEVGKRTPWPEAKDARKTGLNAVLVAALRVQVPS